MIYVISLIALFITVIVLALILFKPSSKYHGIPISEVCNHKMIIIVAIAISMICCTLPMNLSPKENGEIPEHRDQYEKITEAFLDGHLDFGYEVDNRLLELDNPYDPEKRDKENVSFNWDHSFYNGKYYMYFGVVPVIVTFLPYRIITGHSLTTFHATQLYVALFILGVFYCFYLLGKKWFKALPISVYIMLSTAFSVMSTCLAVSRPAMYCTAIAAGIAFMIWSISFSLKAVCESKKISLLYATIGSLLGALVFGCRPPVGLGNLIIFALMIYYIKNSRSHRFRFIKVLSCAFPYVFVGALLMLYNYLRFNSVFEFGQSYQLTMVDVKNTPSLFNTPSFIGKMELIGTYTINFAKYLVGVGEASDFLSVRFIDDTGILLTFPILLYCILGLENESVRSSIKIKRIRLLILALILTPLAIILMDIIGSEVISCRYKMDVYWAFGLLTYMIIGLYYQYKKNKRKFSYFVCVMGIVTILSSVLLFLYPYYDNFTAYYFDEIIGIIS